MPLWWTLIILAAVLVHVYTIGTEIRKPKAERDRRKLKNSVLALALGIVLLIWSQTMLAVITAAFSPFWVCFGAGAVVVLMGLAKQKFRSPAIRRMGKLNILFGLLMMAGAYWFFYLR